MPEPLIIDDIGPSLQAMTNLGRQLLDSSVGRLRNAVHGFATRRRWAVVKHSSFSAWARQVAVETGLQWLMLDPLIPATADGVWWPLRVSRVHDAGKTFLTGSIVSGLGGRIDLASSTGLMGIVDDASSSGSTLRAVFQAAMASGLSIKHVLVCASTRLAREALTQTDRELRWSDHVPGDWRILHLRDGCPFLPFSGRATGALVHLKSASLEVRVPSTRLNGHLWQVMYMDREVRAANDAMYAEIPKRLSEYLGRPAIVADLSLLSSAGNVAQTTDDAMISASTLLEPLYQTPR